MAAPSRCCDSSSHGSAASRVARLRRARVPSTAWSVPQPAGRPRPPPDRRPAPVARCSRAATSAPERCP